jgi:hypothetical protein
MRAIILAVLTILSLNCGAEDYLRLSGVSMHSTAGNNALNYGLGLEHEFDYRWSVAGGWYRNSEWHGSAYAYGRYAVYRDDIWNIGIGVGGVTGYKTFKVTPMALPDICYGVLCMLVAPKLEPSGSNVMAFSLRLPIE